MKRILVAAVFILCPFALLAQTSPDVQQGLIPFGTFQQGNIDSVNLANGNVTIHIPLLAYPQRGGRLGLSFSVIANSKGWFVFNTGTHLNWRYPNPNPNLPPGGPTGVTTAVEDHTLLLGGKLLKITDETGAQYFMHTYLLQTADQASHEIVSTDGEGLLVNSGESIDASGIHFDKTNGDITRDGVRYTGTAMIDPNGNQVTTSSSGWTDTLGRVIPALPGSSTTTTNCPAGTTSAYNWTVPAYNGGTTTFKFCYGTYSYQTAFNEVGINEFGGTTTLMNAIVLPNLTSWKFTYDSYANVTSVAFPTGGSITYTYANKPLQLNQSRVVSSRVLNANDGTGSHTTNYQWNVTVGGQYYNIVTDPAGNDTLNQACGSYVCTTKVYSGPYTGANLLSTTANVYHSETDPYDAWRDSGGAAVNVVLLSKTVTLPGGKTNQTTYTYDSGFTYYMYNYDTTTSSATAYYGQQVLETFSDYGSGSPGSIIRQNPTSYYSGVANALDLVSVSKVLDGNGNACAETDYGYDDTARLVSSGVTMQHGAAPGTNRGNISSITQQLTATPCQPGASWRPITSYVNTYDTGKTYQSIDPLSHTATYTYSPTFYGAYPTQTQLPDTGSPAVHHIASANYDFNTGLLTSTTDPNNLATSFTYDSMWRLSQVNHPDGGKTTISYDDTAPSPSVTTTRLITTAPLNFSTTTIMDGLGRVTQAQLTTDPDGITYADTTYDGLGRVRTQSNPHRSAAAATDGTTTNYFDALGRVCLVVPPDGTLPTGSTCPSSQPSNTIFTTFSDNTTTVIDEAAKSRKTQTDGLRRLTAVWEDPSGLNYETDYTYDPLGNLLTVNQKGNDPSSANWRTRMFTYDSLSRLLTATNPESGTITYAYNDDGTLATKTSPAPNQIGSATVTTTYSYDALNRLTQKSFNDGSTSTINYVYDGGAPPTGCTLPVLTYTNPIGRRTGMCDAAGSEAWAYDSMGRVTSDNRITNNIARLTGYTYNLDGSAASITYSGGETVAYAPGGAGRPLSAVGGATYATNVHYAPSGALCYFQSPSSTSGSLWIHNYTFNSRLQPATIQVINDYTNPPVAQPVCGVSSLYFGGYTTSMLDLRYTFTDPSGHNNGNVVSVAEGDGSGSGPTVNPSRNQSFTYDSLNRIATAKTASTYATSSGNCWAETFNYDPWGNLLKLGGDPVNQSAYIGCTQESGFDFTNLTNNKNQIATSGYAYDAAGNLTTSPDAGAVTLNAENQIVSAGGVTYTYDGDGKRVMKSSGTIYWYGAGSDPLQESDLTGVMLYQHEYFNGMRVGRWEMHTGLNYAWLDHYALDHLGNARFVWGYRGNGGGGWDISTFYPFGSERPTNYNCCVANTYKFTGKERDSESGLDNFGARFNSSAMGRFTSPDPLFGSASISSPQTWNRYSYGLNNPLRNTDPFGLWNWDQSAGGGASDDELEDQANDKSLGRKQRNKAKRALAFRQQFRDALDSANEAAGSDSLNEDQQSQVQAGVDSYGSENDNNGVLVGVRDNASGSKATTILNDNGTISVTFNVGLKNNQLATVLAHEGTHVADNQAWLAVPTGFSPYSLNHYSLEQRAWGVSSYVAQALGLKSYGAGGGSTYEVWNRGWKAADRATLRARGVGNILSYSGYSTTDSDTISAQHPSLTTPP